MLRLWTSPLVVLLLLCSFAAGQAKEKVLYSFGTNPKDGMTPNGGLVFDNAGNLYGTTGYMPSNNCPECGIVFELSPSSSGPWTETILYQFCSLPNCADGQSPRAGVIFDASGNLYGTTKYGGANQHGTVFKLAPPSAPGGSWTETVLWSFNDKDGDAPVAKLTWDASGNLYGTTLGGGTTALGTVFELSPSSGGWTEQMLYSFCPNKPDCSDGYFPEAGVTFDSSGNLFGTTTLGAYDNNWGTVFELSPASGGGWTQTTLYRFSPHHAGQSTSEVFFDHAGNFYGTVSQGGPHSPAQCGGVFRMSPVSGGWKESLFPFDDSGDRGCIPLAGLFVDNKTNTIFGTTQASLFPYGGTVFKMIGTKQTILYTFCQQNHCADGNQANSFLTPNAGKLYGTTLEGGTSSACGQFGCGVVYEITP
jgi:uncharacterized repeat protein (TIGR03803 family)